jgi:hypothetical protein
VSNNIDPRELYKMLQQDASRLGISVEELIGRITGGAQVLGDVGPTRKVAGRPTYMSTGEGGMPQIENEQIGETDDFEDMVNEREAALVEAGGDDLAREVIFQKKLRGIAQANQLVSGNPASALKAAMGSIATVQSGVLGSNAPTVAYWTADNDAETRCVGVTLSMVPVDPTFGNFSVKPFGIVQWGTRGQLNLAEVDILTGCRFTVEGSQVIVQVAQDVAVLPANSSSLLLSGMLSFGSVSRPVPITRTVDVGALGAGTSSAGIPIKPFAKSFYFWRIPTASAVTVQMTNSGLQVLGEVVIAANTSFTDPIIIPNGCTRIVIVDGGAGMTRGEIVFNLAF